MSIFTDHKFTEMTRREKEEERSRQVKCHYASLIQYELQRLTEDQLFKVLTLVKNTIEENFAPPRSKNKSLFCGCTNSTLVPNKNAIEAADFVKGVALGFGFTGGYGIIDFVALSSVWGSPSASATTTQNTASIYVCFCKKDILDIMVEIAPYGNNSVEYKLTWKRVGSEESGYSTSASRQSLVEILRELKTKIIHKND